MFRDITYARLRDVLTGLGFQEVRRKEGAALKHAKSATIFLFPPYRDSEVVKPAEVYHVRQMLDARRLLDADSFDGLVTKAPV